MTLLDAPKFDEARDRRNRVILLSALGLFLVLFVGWWLVAGRPVDWPWNWNAHLMGRATANEFLSAVEKNDLPKAYGFWTHDKNWQQHPVVHGAYPFSRFQEDWSRTSPANEYGVIQSHKIVAARIYGNVLLMAILINGRKSGALDLDYDPKTHTLNFSPPGVELYLGP
jgi:hypothetical protein